MRNRLVMVASSVLVLGCASVPRGPEVMALPGTGRSFEEFRADDGLCRDFAYQQIGGPAREQTANRSLMSQAVLGAAVGAVAGAMIAGREGAGVGAGTGLLIGGASAAESSQFSVYGGQRQYDNAYVQCMYAQGHRVPLGASYTAGTSPPSPPQAPRASPPPPPPGLPPPPPPGVSRP